MSATSSMPRLSTPSTLVQNGDEAKLERFRALLASTTLLRGCPSSAIDDLARRLNVRTKSPGQVVVAQDEPGDAMYIVQAGALKVALFGESGRELTLAELKPGDFFGEMSLLDNCPRSATVVAVTESTVLMLTRDAFAEHLKAHPQTALNILSEMTRRLRRADETIANLALHDVEARLRRTLERLAREDGETVDAGILLRRRPTQQALANMVGSCRETVSRTFTSMIKRGLLIPRGRAVVLTHALLQPPQAA